MVRIKFRYVAIKYSFDEFIKFTIKDKTFVEIINNLIKVKHGELGLSKITHLQIMETYPHHSVILFRIGREACKTVLDTLTNVTSLSGKPCKFNIICVSGGIKNAKIKLISFIKNN